MDPATLAGFKGFVADFKPTRRIHGGDVFDFRWLRGKASQEEKAEEIRSDFQAGLDFLEWYKPTDICWGNHDARLWNRLEVSMIGAERALLASMVDEIAAAVTGCRVVPYDKRLGVIDLGKLRAVHGYNTGIGAVRKTALVYGDCLVFHLHRKERAPTERLDGGTGFAVPSICTIDLPYNRATIGALMHSNGWAYGLTSPSGRNVVWYGENVDGQWIAPTEFSA